MKFNHSNVKKCKMGKHHRQFNKEDCERGAICIKDLTKRVNEYYKNLSECKSNTAIKPWLKSQMKLAKRIPRYFACPTSVYYEHKMSLLFEAISITRLHRDLIMSGVKLPHLPNLLTFTHSVLDRLKKVHVEPRQPSEKVTAPWFTVQGCPKYKFLPEFITHYNTEFSTSCVRLLTTLQKLSEFVDTSSVLLHRHI